MALKVFILRHGETDFNKQGKEWGQSDETTLNEIGIKQSEKLSQRLKGTKFSKIISSDLKRAVQTAEILGSAVGVPVIKDKHLKEYDPGGADPSSEKWIEEYKRLFGQGISKYDIRPFGGENIWDLIKRTKSFLSSLEKENGTIAVMSHSGVNAALINLSQGREKDGFLNIKQDNVCINVIEFSEGKWVVSTINDSDHINEIRPKKKVYSNISEVKELATKYILEKIGSASEEIYLSGDLLSGDFGSYERPYKRYKGSTVEVYAVIKKDFAIPQRWKVSVITKDVEKYEVGKIKVNEVEHKVNASLIQDAGEIKENSEKIK